MPLRAVSPGLCGYCDRLDARPGDEFAVFVSSDEPQVDLDVVRIHAGDGRAVPGSDMETVVATIGHQVVASQRQAVHAGSYGVVQELPALAGGRSLVLSLWALPTRVGGRPQGLVSTMVAGGPEGWAIVLAPDGALEVRAGIQGDSRVLVRGSVPLDCATWIHVRCAFGLDEGTVSLWIQGAGHTFEAAAEWDENVRADVNGMIGRSRLLFAAASTRRLEDGSDVPVDCFNGKLEDVRLDLDGATVARWDFGREPHSDRIVDVTAGGRHGRLHQAPTRAVTGHAWRGRETDFRLAPDEYAATHFHEDDLDDVGWLPAAHVSLPADLPTGIYAVRLQTATAEDRIPFVVLPLPSTGEQRPPVAFLVPTFTYQAYANARLGDQIDYVGAGLSGRDYRPGVRDAQLEAWAALAGSLYDVHSDGSGRCYSTMLRPVFNFRADYVSPVQQASRHLGADLYITAWLHLIGQEHDVLTDHALDGEGIGLLDPYRVLITGTHPEYVSEAMLDAFEAFLGRGGRLLYLGGNGFYWVTSRAAADPHRIEVRRGHAGTRTWESAPGETRHSSTGEPGGLWRHRGRAPNRLVGVGMTSQGWDERAPGYRRTPESHESRTDWIFEGVHGEVFGRDGLVMGGAAGDELDRYDIALGSPPHAVVVATSEPHSRFYKLVLEDVMMIQDGLGGDEHPDVRSDVVCFETPGGGAVFAVGSIAWAGAMAYAAFDNPVACITRNVLERFLTHDQPLL